MSETNIITFDYLLKIVRKYFKYVFSILLSSVFLSIIYCILATPLYKSSVSIYPSYKENNMSNAMGSVLGLTNNMGFNIFDADNNNFDFQDILNSKKLKKSIVLKEWSTYKNSQINLINYWKLKDVGFIGKIKNLFYGDSDKGKNYYTDIAIDNLSSRLEVVKQETGLIFITILMEEQQLSADITNYIASWIDTYISEEMDVQATKNRKFIEERLQNAKEELFISEEKFSAFQKQHSIASDGPETLLEKARLLRNIEVNQEVYITLKQQFELNKIEELKERPVLNILDEGEPASVKSYPKFWIITLIFLFFSFIFSIVALVVYDHSIYSSDSNN